MPTYTFEVAAGLRVPPGTPRLVHRILNSPRGWGLRFVRGTGPGSIRIRLAPEREIERVCDLKGLSCAELGGKRVWINYDRWMHGASATKLSLADYRFYVLNHEIGHILGHEHEKCPCKDCPAPIMMQQTLGIGSCKPDGGRVDQEKKKRVAGSGATHGGTRRRRGRRAGRRTRRH